MRTMRGVRRVAITGLGAITPIGNDAPTTWRSAVEGRSGIDFIRSFDASEFPVLLAVGAAKEALADSGLNGFDPARVGVAVSTAIGGFLGMMEQHDVLRERG